MECIRSDWTIVLAGSWNVAIFQPAWVSANVFEGRDVEIEVQFGPAGAGVRLHCGLATLIALPDKLMGAVRVETAASLTEVERMLQRILAQLPHTPVTGLGINFGFREQQPEEALTRNFAMEDTGRINEFGATVRQTSILRELVLDDDLMRMRETSEDNGSIHFHINFHFDVQNAQAAAQRLAGRAVPKMERVLEFLHRVYGLNLEQANAG